MFHCRLLNPFENMQTAIADKTTIPVMYTNKLVEMIGLRSYFNFFI